MQQKCATCIPIQMWCFSHRATSIWIQKTCRRRCETSITIQNPCIRSRATSNRIQKTLKSAKNHAARLRIKKTSPIGRATCVAFVSIRDVADVVQRPFLIHVLQNSRKVLHDCEGVLETSTTVHPDSGNVFPKVAQRASRLRRCAPEVVQRLY